MSYVVLFADEIEDIKIIPRTKLKYDCLVGFFLPDGRFYAYVGYMENEASKASADCSYLNGGAKPNDY